MPSSPPLHAAVGGRCEGWCVRIPPGSGSGALLQQQDRRSGGPAAWRGATPVLRGLPLGLSHETEGNFHFTEIPGVWGFLLQASESSLGEYY